MKISELCAYIDGLYPRTLSCEWDNDGLMCCADTSADVKKAFIALDATEETVMMASEQGCDLLLTHHPMIFRGVRSVCGDNFAGRRIISALKSNVSVISLHTRLDAGKDGVNDCLVRALGYEADGSFGDADSPSLGRYFDIPGGVGAEEFALCCREKLAAPAVELYGGGNVRRICAVGGSGGDFIRPAMDIGADLLLTGECSYNAALDAAQDGLCVITAGHFYTERPVCQRLAQLCRNLGIPSVYSDEVPFRTF